ncbi:Gfo/Idh/MocA family oxidoreductase [Mucilaginibacter corticis]|uniref:Gfo/Idh/MocA family oxidoreductase n=1 Tax=Mucilaginibacter corticis TaxID=2597670 RepID=A0A556M8X1_9SPHI|nr:Gfo/Idh/MocA family oxidoreductase [Mucilaginibacter corticis]TSJ36340.1 Gfo/Idh/MocA family oxidoreductase [Mucilaginibacter corticis]
MERRDFINKAGTGLAGAALLGGLPAGAATNMKTNKNIDDLITVKLPPLEQATEKEQAVSSIAMPKEKRIGYAIVGLGNLSLGQILPGFGASKYAKPVALVSGDAGKAKKIAAQYGIDPKNIYNYQNFDHIKDNPEIDAVYIVLPNSMHEEYVVRAAKAGKHVLCEKPMATSAQACQRMIDACKQAGKKLMVAYRIQYEPHNRLAKHWVREQKFGKVKLIDLHNSQNIGDLAQWRLHKALAGGGALPDIGLYCLNTARYLLGEEPHTVTATLYSTPGDVRFKEVEETVLWQMQFPGGALVNASTSYGVHQSRRYRCFGDKGGYFGLDPAFDYERLQMEGAYAEGKQEVKIAPSIKEAQQFALEMDHFARCILENKTPYTPGEEGLQDQKIMEAIYVSAKSGQPVKLEPITTLDTFRGTPPEEDA